MIKATATVPVLAISPERQQRCVRDYGSMALMVQMAGCGVKCRDCSSPSQSKLAISREMPVDCIRAQVAQSGCRLAYVFGGEPAMHAGFLPLLDGLVASGINTVVIETPLAVPVQHVFDWRRTAPCRMRLMIRMRLASTWTLPPQIPMSAMTHCDVLACRIASQDDLAESMAAWRSVPPDGPVIQAMPTAEMESETVAAVRESILSRAIRADIRIFG